MNEFDPRDSAALRVIIIRSCGQRSCALWAKTLFLAMDANGAYFVSNAVSFTTTLWMARGDTSPSPSFSPLWISAIERVR